MNLISWNLVMSMVRLSIIILTYYAGRYLSIFLTIPLILIFYGVHETLDRSYQVVDSTTVPVTTYPYEREGGIIGHFNLKDSFKWLNMILKEFWAANRLHVEDRVKNHIWPLIVEECNVLCSFGMHWHSITLEKFTIGDIPIEICQIQAWEEKEGDLIIDLEIKYEGNACAQITFTGEIIKIAMPLTVQNIRIQSAKVRLVLKFENSELPIVSGINFAFLEPPQFEWNLSEWNWHLIPNADKVTIEYLSSNLINRVVLPRMIILPLELSDWMIKKFLNANLEIKTNFDGKNLMLTPNCLVKVEILQADGVLNGNTITCKFEGNTYSGTYDNPNNLDFSCCFPVQHTHGQNLQISVSNGENLIGAVNKSVEDIVANEKSLNWHNLEWASGRIEFSTEVLEVTNSNKNVPKKTPFGILSLLLQSFHGLDDKLYKPIVYVKLQNRALQEEWNSLHPLKSKSRHRLHEGTLMFIKNILDEKLSLSISIWDAKSKRFIGNNQTFEIQNFIGRAVEMLKIELEKGISLSLNVAVYHIDS